MIGTVGAHRRAGQTISKALPASLGLVPQLSSVASS